MVPKRYCNAKNKGREYTIFELNKAIIRLIEKPETSHSNLLKYVSGPDLPTGGEIIISSDEQKKIYKTGKGAFTIRSKWQTEKLKNGSQPFVMWPRKDHLNATPGEKTETSHKK